MAECFPLHGPLTPARISRSCPHCVIPVPPGAVAGQKYHCTRAFHGLAGSDPAFMNGMFLALPCGVNAHGSTGWRFRTRTGKYLMHAYSLFKAPMSRRSDSIRYPIIRLRRSSTGISRRNVPSARGPRRWRAASTRLTTAAHDWLTTRGARDTRSGTLAHDSKRSRYPLRDTRAHDPRSGTPLTKSSL